MLEESLYDFLVNDLLIWNFDKVFKLFFKDM